MDLDGDGIQDIITGSWPGEMFLFKGKGNGEYADKQKILGKDGFALNIGGGVREKEDELWITGDAIFEGEGLNATVTYNGKTYKTKPGQQLMVTGCASAVFAADWNGDGKLDLVVGDIRGRVGVYLNTGTKTKYEFDKPVMLKSDGKQIMVHHGDSGPCVADWDGDGKQDLLVGAGDGSVWFYRNDGTAAEPKLAQGVMLVEAGTTGYDLKTLSTKPTRGTRVKICVVDLNGDGKLDLLLGDYATQKPATKTYTEEEQKKIDEAKKRYGVLQKEFDELVDNVYGPKREKDAKLLNQTSEKLKKVREELMKLHEIIPPETETHGWIWYLERESITAGGPRGPSEIPSKLAPKSVTKIVDK